MKKVIEIVKSKKIIIISLLLVLGTIGSITLAKYIIEEFHGYYLNAKDFYFTSNRLKKDNPTYQINNWSGVGDFNISFDLLAQKNEYVFSPYDIPYITSFTCPNDVTCSLDKTSGTIYNSGNHADTVTLSVHPTRSYSENERLTIGIIAKSTAPYQEEIKATFEYIVGKQGVTFEIEDVPNQVYFLLKITNAITYCKVTSPFLDYSIGDLIDNNVYRTLTNENKAKCISQVAEISFDPNTAIIDTTDNLLESGPYTSTSISGIDYVNSLSFNLEPVSTVALKFYKKNVSANYTYPITNTTSIINVSFHD